MANCTEVYVYEIAPGKLAEFLKIKDRLIRETQDLPGLIASATFQSADDDHLFIDRMTWKSDEYARDGLKAFGTIPIAQKFLSLMTGPPKIGGHFTLVAGG